MNEDRTDSPLPTTGFGDYNSGLIFVKPSFVLLLGRFILIDLQRFLEESSMTVQWYRERSLFIPEYVHRAIYCDAALPKMQSQKTACKTARI